MAKIKHEALEGLVAEVKKITVAAVSSIAGGTDPGAAKMEFGKKFSALSTRIGAELFSVDEEIRGPLKAQIILDLRNFGNRLQAIAETVNQEMQVLISNR